MTHVSIIAPIYNEEQNISEFVSRVKVSIKTISEDFKIIFIDDGSKDESWKLVKEENKKDNRITGIKLSKNFGHHYAITAGLNSVDSDWVVVMDTDLQDRPEVIPDLYRKAQEGFDIVFVNRINRPEPIYYKILQKIFYFVLKITSGIKFDSSQANFSIINRKVVEAFNKFPEQARFYGSTILWLGFRRASINAEHGIRFKGKPTYSLKKRFKLASDIILAFSDRPLKFSVVIGIFFSLISIVIIIYVLLRFFSIGFSVSGWTSLILSIFLIGGIQISILGMLGIYINKIFTEVKSRPLYLIDETIN